MEPASVTIKKKRALRLAFSVVVGLRFSLSCGGPWCGHRSDDDRPVAQARRGADGRQEGRERGYYHLHRQLDDALLLHFFSLIDCFFISHRNHRNHRNFSSFGLFYCPEVFFYCPAEMKEIKEIFRFTLYAQPVPEALSVISVNFCVTFSRCRRRRCRRCRSRAAERCRRSPRRSRPSPATWPRRTSG